MLQESQFEKKLTKVMKMLSIFLVLITSVYFFSHTYFFIDKNRTVSLEKLELFKSDTCVFDGIKSHLIGESIVRNNDLNLIKEKCSKIIKLQSNPTYQEQLKILED